MDAHCEVENTLRQSMWERAPASLKEEESSVDQSQGTPVIPVGSA